MREIFGVFGILPRNQYLSCVGMFVAIALGSLLEAVGIGAVLPLISLLGNPDFLGQYPYIAELADSVGIKRYSDIIVVASLLILGVYFLKNLFIAWESRMQIDFAKRNQIYYAKALLAEYLMKPYLFHVNHNTATLIRNVDIGVQSVFGSLIVALQLLTEIMTVLTIWGMLVMVDSFAAITVAGSLVILLFAILRAFRQQIVLQGEVRNQCAAQYVKWIHQSLGSIKETKIMHKEAFFLEEFSKAYTEYGKAQGRFSFLNQIPKNIIEFLVLSALMFLIIGKTLLGEKPENVVSMLGVLALVAFRLMPSANRIVTYVNSIKFQMPLFRELYQEFMDIRNRRNRHEQMQIAKQVSKMRFVEAIAVRDLSFCYPDATKGVLRNASFVIPKGAYVGVVGPSGAGKTTFVDILLGLLPPTKGSICVDGKDIQTDIRGWQENLAYVPQNIYLIDATIKENIALGEATESKNDTKIEKALRMAELYDFVAELPEGINAMVGERGVKLSGGQRQRIGIARALYQEPEVLVLDEATSALDNVTEKSITDTILRLKGQMTIISIAHRVSTLENCDFKVEFQRGKARIVIES